MSSETVKSVKKLISGEKVRRPRGDRDAAIRFCPKYKEIHEMLVRGEDIRDVRNAIREWGVLNDMSDAALDRALFRYRSHIDIGELVAKHQPKLIIQAVKEFKSVITMMKEMQSIIAMADYKAMADFNVEKMMRMLSSGNFEEVQRKIQDVCSRGEQTMEKSFQLRERLIYLVFRLSLLQRFLESGSEGGLVGGEAERAIEERLLKRYGVNSSVGRVAKDEHSVLKAGGAIESVAMGGEDFVKRLVQKHPKLMLGLDKSPDFNESGGKTKKKANRKKQKK